MDFVYVNINIYLLCIPLFLHVGVLAEMLTLEMGSIDGLLMLNKESVQKNAAKYSYSPRPKTNEDFVNIACKANYSVENPALKWQIGVGNGHADCQEQKATEINYVINLAALRESKTLTCSLLNSTNTEVATAKLELPCSRYCIGSQKKFDANCFKNTDEVVEMYVNGIWKRPNTTERAIKDSNFTIYCIIQADSTHTVDLDTNNVKIPSFRLQKLSNSVLVFRVTMSDDLDDQTLSCVKKFEGTVVQRSTASVHFKLYSAHRIDINQSGKKWTTYRERTELQYKDNDTIRLTCVYSNSATIMNNMLWTINGKEVLTKGNNKSLIYEDKFSPQDDGSDITCMNIVNEVLHNSTIVLKYLNPEENRPNSNNNIESVSNTDRHTQVGKKPNDFDFKWIAIAVAIAVIIVTIVFVAWKYKPWKKIATVTNEISYINFQEIYTAPERPVLEPTYAGPVDDANMYAYTYNQKPTQETYSTPFVPTVAEMYTAPIPKAARGSPTGPTYTLPGKFTYGNVSYARPNPQEPGYSYVSGNASDSASETYIYSQGVYCRPKQLDSKSTH